MKWMLATAAAITMFFSPSLGQMPPSVEGILQSVFSTVNAPGDKKQEPANKPAEKAKEKPQQAAEKKVDKEKSEKKRISNSEGTSRDQVTEKPQKGASEATRDHSDSLQVPEKKGNDEKSGDQKKNSAQDQSQKATKQDQNEGQDQNQSKKPKWEQKADKIIQFGKKFMGTDYKLGAEYNKSGKFDCSSFTQYVYKKHGIKLNRTAGAQAKWDGQPIHDRSKLRKGDLVFFDASRSAKGRYKNIDHVGIYIGNNQILHTYKKGVGVTITKFNGSFWGKQAIMGARVIGDNGEEPH
ncbi:NlpC/P60 family protein [Melghirimyces thermohalophilus]|uniref:NlpC/P60 family protein n=1 Tax=Melghirimyces thermohalophilus TaxID=1236220 RepID=A0A1G6PP82_9BACL|nr:C40 family peptidase [Melghirimyces thermohalophilus]SDC82020.1 NlpC/P60 family protein [Melghirimyces thermohalophilus]